MKTNFKPLIIAAVMLGTTASYAVESTYNANNNDNKIETSNKKTQQSWAIKDIKGTKLYEMNGIATQGDFDRLELEDGSYTFEVEKGFEIQVTPLKVQNGIATLVKKEEKTIHIPVFRKESNKVLVSQLALDSESLEVKIFYEGDIIFDDVVKGGTVLGRVYKLRKDIKGDYKVVMKANDRIYTKEFSL